MKQLKSSLQDLKDLFEESITAGRVAEPFASFDSSADAHEVHDFMKQKDFDVVGVRQGGLVCGYVNRYDLGGGKLSKYRVTVLEEDLVTEGTPLIDVFRSLRIRPWVLVAVLREPVGIVTRGDLQKIPVRMWVFGLISLVEMQFLRLIRDHYQEVQWKQMLKPDRLAKAERLLRERKRGNEAIDLADCLQFCDKRDIVLSLDQLRVDLGLESKSSGTSFLTKLERMRDNLAHAQDIMTRRWPEIVDLAERAEMLLEKCERVAAPTHYKAG